MDKTERSIPDSEQQPVPHGRVASIDALRGFDMFLLIGGGAIFRSLAGLLGDSTLGDLIRTQFSHVDWEGFAFWDLIMPLFLFICGVAMPYSFAKRLERGDSKTKLYRHVIIRVVILWVLGMIKQGHLLEFDLERLALYSNTLQTIAVGYLVSAILILECKLIVQITVTAGLLLVFWALMMLVPIPSYGVGEPVEGATLVGGMLEPQVNLAIYLDHLILGRFQDGTSYSWILSSLVFGVTVMMGAFAGMWLRTNRNGGVKAIGLLVAGAVSIGAGLLWGLVFPIIKHLWTSSFVLFSGGICLMLLGLFYLVIDVWKFRGWAYVFIVIGANAIFAYMATSFIPYWDIAGRFIGGLKDRLGDWYPLTHGVVAFALAWLVLWYMHCKKTFIKV
jgi:predicted acyltransferase